MSAKPPRLRSSGEIDQLADTTLTRHGRLTGKEWAHAMFVEEPMSCEHIFSEKVGLILSETQIKAICAAPSISERRKLYKDLVVNSTMRTINRNWGTRMRRRVTKMDPLHPVWGGSMNGYTRKPNLTDRIRFVRYTISRNANCAVQFSESVTVMNHAYSHKHANLMAALRKYTHDAMSKSVLDPILKEVILL